MSYKQKEKWSQVTSPGLVLALLKLPQGLWAWVSWIWENDSGGKKENGLEARGTGIIGSSEAVDRKKEKTCGSAAGLLWSYIPQCARKQSYMMRRSLALFSTQEWWMSHQVDGARRCRTAEARYGFRNICPQGRNMLSKYGKRHPIQVRGRRFEINISFKGKRGLAGQPLCRGPLTLGRTPGKSISR